jgi:hypothetical protein
MMREIIIPQKFRQQQVLQLALVQRFHVARLVVDQQVKPQRQERDDPWQIFQEVKTTSPWIKRCRDDRLDRPDPHRLEDNEQEDINNDFQGYEARPVLRAAAPDI